MRKYGIVLFVLGCIISLFGVGQNCAFAACTPSEGLPCGFDSVVPVYLQDRTPLEQQIHDLESQLQNNGKSMPLDDAAYQQLKLELAELYSQLPRERDPLDDGADACPAVDMPTNIQPWTDYGTTIGAANNFTSFAPCGPSTAPDKIYRFIPANTGNYTFDTFGSDFDTQLYIRSGGACPGTNALVCNDDFGGSQSKVQWLMNAGQAYYIIVDGFQNYSGNFVLHLTIECAIGNNPAWQQECAESVGDPSHAQWDCNGGCNNQWYGGFPQWQQMNLCQIQRGECFTYQDPNNISIRDIDCYYFTLTEPCSVSITIFSTFSYNVQINEYGFCVPQNFVSLLNIPSCNGGTIITQCLPAGTYSFEVSPNFYSGMTTPQPYFFFLDPIPCSGCRIDASFIAPSSFTANGCDNISHNSLRPSNDATYCVVIPYASDWTFSLCGSPAWNSYLYLTSECNGGIIAQDNDGCPANGLSKIECVSLMPGNYYLTIEGFNANDCGQFYLTATECVGSCCYGDMWNPSCSFGSHTACDALGGNFTLGQQCTPGLCYPRPGCDAPSAFSQQPHVPDENWTALASDNYLVNRVWENYTATGWIKSVRFWGLSLDYNTGLACTEQPGSFEITFVDSSNGPQVQTYNVQSAGLPLLQNYGANYVMTEYNVDLPTPCPILNGRVSIRGSDNDACVWHWATSPQGNNSVVLVNSGGPINLARDMAICMEQGCPAPDSVTINVHINYFTYYVSFRTLADGYISVFYSDSINSVYPNNYLQAFAPIWYPAGTYSHHDVNPPSQNRRYVVTLNCAPQPTNADFGPSPLMPSDRNGLKETEWDYQR